MIEAIVGFVTGVIASMGLGGGFILVVWLTVFAETEQKAAQGINLLFFLPIALISIIIHLKNGLVNKALVKKLVLGGILGAVIGTLGTMWIDNTLLRKLFAVFLLIFGLRELFSRRKSANTANANLTQSKKQLHQQHITSRSASDGQQHLSFPKMNRYNNRN